MLKAIDQMSKEVAGQHVQSRECSSQVWPWARVRGSNMLIFSQMELQYWYELSLLKSEQDTWMPTRNENVTYARSELQSSLDQNPVQKFRILASSREREHFYKFFRTTSRHPRSTFQQPSSKRIHWSVFSIDTWIALLTCPFLMNGPNRSPSPYIFSPTLSWNCMVIHRSPWSGFVSTALGFNAAVFFLI